MKFFFDNCLPPKFAEVLAKLDEHGDTFAHLRDKFAGNTADSEWLKELSKDAGWVLVSHDKLWRVRHQRELLRSAALVAFFLNDGWEHLPVMEKMRKLLGIWDKLRETASGAKPGQCFKVPASGKTIVPFAV